MDTKAAFESLLKLSGSPKAEDDDLVKSMEKWLGELKFMELYKKPEIQRLLYSDVMREAVEVSEIPFLQELYSQYYHQTVYDKSFNITKDTIYWMAFIIPVSLLLLSFGKCMCTYNNHSIPFSVLNVVTLVGADLFKTCN